MRNLVWCDANAPRVRAGVPRPGVAQVWRDFALSRIWRCPWARDRARSQSWPIDGWRARQRRIRSEAGRRSPARLLPHLRRARLRGTDLGYVVHDNRARIKDIKKGFAAACKRAGLENVSPHTLKHTAATWLMQAGVPLWQAAGFLSTSEGTLQRVYAHHHPDYMRDAADAIGKKPFRRISA
jgi:integrase